MAEVVALVLLIGAVAGMVGLTAVGAHRRGRRLPLALLSALVFPVTWVAWYVRDQRPFRPVRR